MIPNWHIEIISPFLAEIGISGAPSTYIEVGIGYDGIVVDKTAIYNYLVKMVITDPHGLKEKSIISKIQSEWKKKYYQEDEPKKEGTSEMSSKCDPVHEWLVEISEDEKSYIVHTTKLNQFAYHEFNVQKNGEPGAQSIFELAKFYGLNEKDKEYLYLKIICEVPTAVFFAKFAEKECDDFIHLCEDYVASKVNPKFVNLDLDNATKKEIAMMRGAFQDEVYKLNYLKSNKADNTWLPVQERKALFIKNLTDVQRSLWNLEQTVNKAIATLHNKMSAKTQEEPTQKCDPVFTWLVNVDAGFILVKVSSKLPWYDFSMDDDEKDTIWDAAGSLAHKFKLTEIERDYIYCKMLCNVPSAPFKAWYVIDSCDRLITLAEAEVAKINLDLNSNQATSVATLLKSASVNKCLHNMLDFQTSLKSGPFNTDSLRKKKFDIISTQLMRELSYLKKAAYEAIYGVENKSSNNVEKKTFHPKKETVKKMITGKHQLKQIEDAGANTPVTEFHPYHMAWCVLNGQGYAFTERNDHGDTNAKYGAERFFLPVRGAFPGLKIEPYRGNLSANWGPLGIGEAEILLRYIYAIQRELHPFTFKREMSQLRHWIWGHMRGIKKVLMFRDFFNKELASLDRTPVFIGRDTYPIAFLYHLLQENSLYLEGISRTVCTKEKHYSPEYVKSQTLQMPIRDLLFVDTGFRGSIPKDILKSVYGVITEAPKEPWSLEKINKSTKYASGAIYLMSSDAGKNIKAFSQYNYNYSEERKEFILPSNRMSPQAYRDKIVHLEYMPKLYLRPVEVIDGRPKMVPSGDAIKAALLNVAIVMLAEQMYPKKDFDVLCGYPQVNKKLTAAEKNKLENLIKKLENSI